MAIINCPECNREISDQAPYCPHCGLPIAGNVRVCPDCGKTLLRSATECPNCKCALTPIPSDEGSSDGGRKNKSKNHSGGKATKASVVWPVVLLLLVIAGVGIWKLYSDFKERQIMEAAYAALATSYDARDYQNFLTHYPSSEHKSEVAARMEQLLIIDSDWSKTRTLPTRDNLKLFLSKYPESKYSSTCSSLIDSIDWREASALNTTDSYRRYIEAHSDGEYLNLAVKAIENLENPIVTQANRDRVRSVLEKFFTAFYNRDEEALSKIVSQKMLSETMNFLRNNNDSLLFKLSGYISIQKIPAPQVGNVYSAKFLMRRVIDSGSVLYSADSRISTNYEIQQIKWSRYTSESYTAPATSGNDSVELSSTVEEVSSPVEQSKADTVATGTPQAQ